MPILLKDNIILRDYHHGGTELLRNNEAQMHL
jgi:hypothetical protein